MKQRLRCTFFIEWVQTGVLGRPGDARMKRHKTTSVVWMAET
jgi:hypothetical protein